MLIFQEIQRGAEPMKKQQFFAEVGATAACTLQLLLGAAFSGQGLKERVDARKVRRRFLVFADSWFGSVKLAENLELLWREERNDGIYEYHIRKDLGLNLKAPEICAAVKTNSGWFPKQELEKKMEKWPSGSYLVLECKTPETNVDLVAIGYKYNARKVLCFIMTKNTGSTAPDPWLYIAKFPDKFRNVMERRVPCPEVIGDYFKHSNVIDSHNHCRQHLLGLERHWKTPNPWFRNDCTWIGMTAIDIFRGIQYHCPHLKETLTVKNYANSLAWDCVHNPFGTTVGSARTYIASDMGPAGQASQQNCLWMESQRDRVRDATDQIIDGLGTMASSGSSMESVLSPITADSRHFEEDYSLDIGEHDPIPIGKQNTKDGRSVKRRCVVCGMDTRLQCSHGFCRSRPKEEKSKMYYGTWICDPKVGARKNAQVQRKCPGNGLTCLQLHRREFKAQKLAEYSDRLS
jgi:hypothetical protein